MQQSVEQQEIQHQERKYAAEGAGTGQGQDEYERAYVEQILRETLLWQRRIEANSY